MTFSSMSPGRRKHGGVYVLISLNDAILERLSSFLALILQTISHEPTTLKQQPRRHTKLSSVWGNSAYLQWLLQTCRCTIESLVLGCTTAWLGNSSAQVRKKLQCCKCSPIHHTGENSHLRLHLHFPFHRKNSQHNQWIVPPVIRCSPCSRWQKLES